MNTRCVAPIFYCIFVCHLSLCAEPVPAVSPADPVIAPTAVNTSPIINDAQPITALKTQLAEKDDILKQQHLLIQALIKKHELDLKKAWETADELNKYWCMRLKLYKYTCTAAAVLGSCSALYYYWDTLQAAGNHMYARLQKMFKKRKRHSIDE